MRMSYDLDAEMHGKFTVEAIDAASVDVLGVAAVTMLQHAELDMLGRQRTAADFRRVQMLRDIVADLPPDVVHGA